MPHTRFCLGRGRSVLVGELIVRDRIKDDYDAGQSSVPVGDSDRVVGFSGDLNLGLNLHDRLHFSQDVVEEGGDKVARAVKLGFLCVRGRHALKNGAETVVGGRSNRIADPVGCCEKFLLEFLAGKSGGGLVPDFNRLLNIFRTVEGRRNRLCVLEPDQKGIHVGKVFLDRIVKMVLASACLLESSGAPARVKEAEQGEKQTREPLFHSQHYYNLTRMSIGVPIKLLHEAELHVVTVELKTGELYRGYLMEAEDTMNMRLDDVFVTRRDGKQLHFDQVFVRGSQVRFIVIPDMLKNSPMFKRISNQAKKGKNALLNKGKNQPSTAPGKF